MYAVYADRLKVIQVLWWVCHGWLCLAVDYGRGKSKSTRNDIRIRFCHTFSSKFRSSFSPIFYRSKIIRLFYFDRKFALRVLTPKISFAVDDIPIKDTSLHETASFVPSCVFLQCPVHVEWALASETRRKSGKTWSHNLNFTHLRERHLGRLRTFLAHSEISSTLSTAQYFVLIHSGVPDTQGSNMEEASAAIW